MILEYIAQDLVESTTNILGYPISITDEKGYIIAATDRSRIGAFHPVSLEVIQKKALISYNQKDVQHLKNVLPGVASPIMLNEKAIGVLGIVGEPDKVCNYVQLVKSHVELMCQEVLKKEMTALHSKTIETLVQYLIQLGSSDNSEQLVRYGSLLGYNLELPRMCMLLDIDMVSISFLTKKAKHNMLLSQYVHQELLDYIEYIFKDNKEDIICLLNVEQVIILKAVKPNKNMDKCMQSIEQKLHTLNKYLQNNYHVMATLALGGISNGVEGVKHSYHHAMTALTVGKRTKIEPPIYDYNNWQITLEILAKELPKELEGKLTSSFSKIIHQKQARMLTETFMMYCRCNMNLSKTERNLYIHRNTLVYRLNKIGKLTSLNLSNFEHCILLYITIKNYFHTTALK